MRADSGMKRFTKRVERARADIPEHHTDTANGKRPEMLLTMATVMGTILIMGVLTMVTVMTMVCVVVDTMMGRHSNTTDTPPLRSEAARL